MPLPLNILPRPFRWGFFIFLFVAVGLVGLRFAGRAVIAKGWEESRFERESKIRFQVQSVVRERVEELLNLATSVTHDRVLFEVLLSDVPQTMEQGFRKLESLQEGTELTIDVTDPHGTIVAWAGRKIVDEYSSIINEQKSDSFAVITQANLHSYLSLCLPAMEGKFFVFVNAPLEVTYPLSNRFVRQTSFRESFSERMGRPIQLLYRTKQAAQTGESSLRIELTDFRGMPFAVALTPAPTLDREENDYVEIIDQLLVGCVSFFLLFALVALFMVASGNVSPWIRLLSTLGAIWAVRYGWKSMEFPASIVGGPLFNPGFYASPFGGGLASSVGETLISGFALFATLTVLFRESSFFRVREAQGTSRRWGQIPEILLSWFILLALLRAYGAALRSFVFDSTLQYVNPTTLIPDPLVSAMYGNIILLTGSLLLAAILAVRLISGLANSVVVHGRERLALGIFVGSFLFIWAGFVAFDRNPQVPVFSPPLLVAAAILLLRLKERSRSSSQGTQSILLLGMAFLVGAFVFSTPVFDEKLHLKEQERVRVYAEELLRPVDSWLSFVVTDGFRSIGGRFSAADSSENVQQEEMMQAFPLWAGTIMSREGYNSGVVLYDPNGKEISRFAVGLTGYEQSELLKRMFDSDEESLVVTERSVPAGTIRYYGMWGTVRLRDGRPRGFVAVLLSASQRALFRGEAPAPLRALDGSELQSPHRRIVISEYQNGNLVSTTAPDQASDLKEKDRRALQSGEGRFFTTEEKIGDGEFHILYAKDEANPGRVVSIGVEEEGLRWHLFSLAKVLAIYFGLTLIGCAVVLVLRWRDYRALLTGFRGRLIASLLLIAGIPMLVFGYYNREFAQERLEASISKKLLQDLDLITQRVVNSVSDEEDFLKGVNDDFCETVASEYGVDFTIYRREKVHSSSRPELYQSNLLDSRLPGVVFARMFILGSNYLQTAEQVGNVEYAVGYKPVLLDGRIAGVVGIPTIYQQADLDEELAQRNAFVLGVYTVIILLTLVGGILLANQLSRPVTELTKAARALGKGDLNVAVKGGSDGEIGELVTTFNTMVRELKQSRDELKRAERDLAWKEMAKQVAHEIKNPLTPMKLSMQHLVQAFKDNAKDLPSIIVRVSQTITDQIDALARIATEFSNFARMPERRFERLDLQALLTETIDLFKEVRGIELRAIFSDTPLTVVADKDELKRVFINILRNAVQAMERGGMITVETALAPGGCFIRITDTGGGIPEQVLQRVFEPNFSTKTDGMGLGLAIARKVIEDMSGSISVRSEVGRGTTVEILLPLNPGVNA